MFSLSISDGDSFISVESLITAALLGLHEVRILEPALSTTPCYYDMETTSDSMQIIVDTDAHNGAYILHAQGVSAILMSKASPFDLMCDGHLFKAPNSSSGKGNDLESFKIPTWQDSPPGSRKVLSRFSVLCTKPSKPMVVTIDEMFARTEPLVQKATSLLAGSATLAQLLSVKLEAEKLNDDYKPWQENPLEEWKPRAAGVILSCDKETLWVDRYS